MKRPRHRIRMGEAGFISCQDGNGKLRLKWGAAVLACCGHKMPLSKVSALAQIFHWVFFDEVAQHGYQGFEVNLKSFCFFPPFHRNLIEISSKTPDTKVFHVLMENLG